MIVAANCFSRLKFLGIAVAVAFLPCIASAENWPRWRGPDGNAVSAAARLPVTWSPTENVRWKVAIDGEGSSSPIVWAGRIFITSALDDGTRRVVQCLDVKDGHTLWTRSIDDENPELTSALTGHAAATPVTDGAHVVAMFGNAGVVCYDLQGKELWRRRFGEFESELGFASSPIIVGKLVILVCDHDGDHFKSFDSFLVALDLETGEPRWKTERRGLYRSWSTPIVVPAGGDLRELVVNAQDELRAYDVETGRQTWNVRGMTGWVTPSPVFGIGYVFACSGKDGPTMAVRPGGTGDATGTHVAWQQERGAPYVCSPVLYRGLLAVQNEQGVLACYRATQGELCYRTRLAGKFISSPIAGDGRIYFTNDEGTTYVVAAGESFQLLAKNSLHEESLASPAVANEDLLLRTEHHLYCITSQKE